jgi:hypothetical protein
MEHVDIPIKRFSYKTRFHFFFPRPVFISCTSFAARQMRFITKFVTTIDPSFLSFFYGVSLPTRRISTKDTDRKFPFASSYFLNKFLHCVALFAAWSFDDYSRQQQKKESD